MRRKLFTAEAAEDTEESAEEGSEIVTAQPQ
jgi:hypothetical protein